MVESYSVPWIDKVHALIINAIDNDTGDNGIIIDQPARWGNQPDYRIFNLEQAKTDDRNWYKTRLNAVNKILGLSESVFAKVYYRGDSKDWQATLMTEREVNIWTITIDTDGRSGLGFKFDIFDDWKENYGDDDNDGVLERSGSNILFNQGQGKYLITFNAFEKSYGIEKLDDFPLNDDASGDVFLPSETEVDNNETANVNNNENDELIPPVLLAPIANAGLDVEVYIDETVHFDASLSTDIDGEIIYYQWSNGLEGVSFSTLFSKAGTYQIALTVTDNDQQVASDSRTIVVKNREGNGSSLEANETSTDLTNNDSVTITESTNESDEAMPNNKKSGGTTSWLFWLVMVPILVKRNYVTTK
jgi:hypothetical protein